ncbi:Protein of unknown function [Modicisalibacter muralis]|uniref:DUF3261 domain-containing protein n=1 Tax=Modicisalibacter muralis TaxID=119000 RepID=A0A1G9HYR1_9GAMM|nr:DUF3261 domain-containing protein [Halomonas muralis]SDL18137.1 Protein of unknown function [Halomonas muralis]
MSQPVRRPAAQSRAWLWLSMTLLLSMALAGCATRPSPAPSPAFASVDFAGTLKRRLTFIPYDDDRPTRELIGLVELGDNRLRAVLLTPFGQRLVTLEHDSEGSRFVPGDVPPEALREALPISPEWLASRLEWSLWPTQALRDAFAGSEWSVAIDDGRRMIRHHDDVVARIAPATASAETVGTVLLDDRQGHYLLRISPLDAPDHQEPDHD